LQQQGQLKMSGSVNKATLLGNLGADPEIRSLPNGGKVANLRVATSESWKDRATGERKEKTEWHSVSVFVEGLVGVVESFCKKGQTVYIEGKIQTRKYEKDGQERYATEIVLQGPGSVLTMVGGAGNSEGGEARGNGGGARSNGAANGGARGGSPAPAKAYDEFADDIPF
jgi:single-strand DNA-binding protein